MTSCSSPTCIGGRTCGAVLTQRPRKIPPGHREKSEQIHTFSDGQVRNSAPGTGRGKQVGRARGSCFRYRPATPIPPPVRRPCPTRWNQPSRPEVGRTARRNRWNSGPDRRHDIGPGGGIAKTAPRMDRRPSWPVPFTFDLQPARQERGPVGVCCPGTHAIRPRTLPVHLQVRTGCKARDEPISRSARDRPGVLVSVSGSEAVGGRKPGCRSAGRKGMSRAVKPRHGRSFQADVLMPWKMPARGVSKKGPHAASTPGSAVDEGPHPWAFHPRRAERAFWVLPMLRPRSRPGAR